MKIASKFHFIFVSTLGLCSGLLAQDLNGNSKIEAEKEVVINELLRTRVDIEKRFPILEDERNRLFKLTNELKNDIRMGCQANEPIRSLRVEVDGSEIPTRELGTSKKKKIAPQNIGNCTELEFKFGAAAAFTVDQATRSIFKSGYETGDLSNQAVVGGLEYLQITKKGICLENLRKCHLSGFGSETCEYDVYEHNMYTITGIRVFANSRLAYARTGLNIIFDADHSPTWSDNTFISNESWIKLMQQEDCNKSG